MKKRHILPFLILLMHLMSCKKVLDVEMVTTIPFDMAITSGKDLEAILTGSYDALQSGNVLGGNLVVYADLLGDDTEVNESKLYPFGTQEIYQRNMTMQLNPLRSTWRDAYSAIHRANLVLNTIDDGIIADGYIEKNKSRLSGEALFIRAIVHFELLRFWSQPYDIDDQGGNDQLGIPYRKRATTSGFENHAMARNTVEECYAYIIEDLKEAQQLLTLSGISTSDDRASSSAALAYLSRVYFYKGDYSNAFQTAEEVITISYFKLDTMIQEAFQTSGNFHPDETIFQLVNISDDQSNALLGNYVTSDNSTPLFGGTLELKDLIETTDQRRTKYIAFNFFKQEVYITKYRSTNPAPNVCIIRLTEMYLISAESAYMLNDTLAYSRYRTVLARAYASKYDSTATILWNDLLTLIRNERRKELCFEGDRYHNLRRMKQPVRGGVTYNDPSLLFKIPQEEMAGNSLMVQN